MLIVMLCLYYNLDNIWVVYISSWWNHVTNNKSASSLRSKWFFNSQWKSLCCEYKVPNAVIMIINFLCNYKLHFWWSLYRMYMMELTRLIIFHEMLMNWDNSRENLCIKEIITKTTTAIPFGKLSGNDCIPRNEKTLGIVSERI